GIACGLTWCESLGNSIATALDTANGSANDTRRGGSGPRRGGGCRETVGRLSSGLPRGSVRVCARRRAAEHTLRVSLAAQYESGWAAPPFFMTDEMLSDDPEIRVFPISPTRMAKV